MISYITDVPIDEGFDSEGNKLQLLLRRGQLLLASPNMIYSYGDRYQVLREAYSHFEVYSSPPENVLLLGAGIASGLQLLYSKGIYSNAVLVERESLICRWLHSYVISRLEKSNVKVLCEDVRKVLDSLNDDFDLIVVDIFVDNLVPAFVGQRSFIEKMLELLSSNGLALINITREPAENRELIKQVEEVLNDLSVNYHTFDVGQKNIVYGVRRK